NDLCCFDNLNEINLIAAAALARGETIDATGACRFWLRATGWEEAAAPWLAGLLSRTLPTVRNAAYRNDHVFADNSMLPRSIKRAWWGMEDRDSLAVWDPGRASDLRLDREKVARLLAEKEQALGEVQALMRDVEAGNAAAGPALQRWVRA